MGMGAQDPLEVELVNFGMGSLPTMKQNKKWSRIIVLVTRFLVIRHIADIYNPSGYLSALENPEDPYIYLPESKANPEQSSIWAWPELWSLWNAIEDIYDMGPEKASEGEFRERGDSNQSR